MEALTRNQLREKTVDSIYSCLIQEQAKVDYDPGEVFTNIFKANDFSEVDIFARDIFVQALRNKEAIIALVQPYLKKWTFKRLNTIAQAIFLEAVSECKYCHYNSKGICINSSVELAKRYLDATDYKYINAVLDKVL